MPKIRNMGSSTMKFNEGIIVSGSAGVDIHALVVTGSTSIVGNLSDYVVVIDNDQSSSGHVLKLLTDGNGANSRVLEMEDGDGDIIFRARADGRFGFGPDGVDSMGAGTFVVGIDNSSHTSDIAISRRLQHLGDSNTYLDFPSNDNITFAAGGSEELKIASDGILVKNIIKHDGDEDTRIIFNDNQIILKAGNIALVTAEKNSSAPHEVTINDGSNNVDFVVKGNGSNQGNPGMKFDASTNKLGINGIGTPGYELDVDGIINSRSDLYVSGNLYVVDTAGLYADKIRRRSDSDNTTKILLNDELLKFYAGHSTEDIVRIGETNKGNDNNFWVSGSAGSKGSTDRGTAVFGGDLVVSGALHMGAAYKFPISDGSNNQVMKTDGSGNLSWTNQSGGGSGDNLSLTALKTSNYTAANWEMVLVNLVGASGDVTITLPAASSNKQVAVKIAGLAMGKEVIVDGNGSQTIDGLTTRIMNTDYESIHLISDGSNWWRIS